MFGRLKHISFLLTLALGLSFVLPAAAQTSADEGYQKLITSQTASEFASTHGGSQYADTLTENAAGGGKIICGDSKTVCDGETQFCLRCLRKVKREVLWLFDAENILDEGRCLPKEKVDPDNLNKSWPECINMNKQLDLKVRKDQVFSNLTIESNGFLSTTQVQSYLITYYRKKETFTSNGKSYNLVISGKNPTIQYAGDSNNKSFKGCEVLPVKLYNMQGCFFCPLARLIFDTSNDMTRDSFNYFAEGFIAVLVVMFAIWLALAALQQVFSMTKQDAPKFLSAIVKQGFKFLLAGLLLANSNTLFEYFIVPVLEGGLAMGRAIQTVEVSLRDDYKPLQSQTAADYFNLTQTSEVVSVNGKETTVNKGLYQKIDEYLAGLQGHIAYMQAVGTTLFCVGGHEAITLKLEEFKSGLSMMFLGAILTVFGFLLTISFGFYFLDAILQLAILGVMLPFMIAGWPFKATAQYASTGFKMLLNTFFVMFFTGFVVSVSMTLVDQAISQTAAIEEAERGASGLVGFAEAFNEQNIERVRELTDLGGSGFLLLIFACLFGFKFVGQVTPLAGKLASGGLKPLAGKIGTMAASATKGMATKVTAPVRQGFEKETGGVMGIAAGTAGGIARAVGKGLSKGGEALSQKGKVGKAAGWVVNKLGQGVSGVGNLGKKVQKAYKDEANRPKK